jgi:hypothetical protein
MLQMAFVLLVGFQSTAGLVAQPTTRSEIKDALAYAEALYYSRT